MAQLCHPVEQPELAWTANSSVDFSDIDLSWFVDWSLTAPGCQKAGFLLVKPSTCSAGLWGAVFGHHPGCLSWGGLLSRAFRCFLLGGILSILTKDLILTQSQPSARFPWQCFYSHFARHLPSPDLQGDPRGSCHCALLMWGILAAAGFKGDWHASEILQSHPIKPLPLQCCQPELCQGSRDGCGTAQVSLVPCPAQQRSSRKEVKLLWAEHLGQADSEKGEGAHWEMGRRAGNQGAPLWLDVCKVKLIL